MSSTARSVNEIDSFVNSATKMTKGSVKTSSRGRVPQAKSFMKGGYINEVEALRAVFFTFFHAQKQEGKVGRKRSDLLKMEFDEISANPFFNDELRLFDEDLFVEDESPKKRSESPANKRRNFAKMQSNSIEIASKLEKMAEQTPPIIRNSESVEKVVD